MTDLVEWVLLNIEGVASDYYFLMPEIDFEDYLLERTVEELSLQYSYEDIRIMFCDNKIIQIINFFRRENESDTIH